MQRPGPPPSWQGPPPGAQFRPHVNPGQPPSSGGVPGTLADALQNPISPLPAGPPSSSSYFRPGVNRPSAPPSGFQPSQSMPPISAPPPLFSRPPPPMAGPPGGNFHPQSFSTPSASPMGMGAPPPAQTIPHGSVPFVPSSAQPPHVTGSMPPPQGPGGYPPSSRYPAMSGPPSFSVPPLSGPPPQNTRPLFNNPSQIAQSQGPQFGVPPHQQQHQFNPVQQQSTSPYDLSTPLLSSQPQPPQFSSVNPPKFGGPPSSQGFYGGPPPSAMPGQYGDGHGGAFAPPPPPLGSYGATFQQQAQGLVEDFQSLSLVPLPGSVDSTVDPGTLPRPRDAEDMNATGSQNCHSRYLRLTTNAMPNAHSLVARWHLPLGAVAHPLAEAPPGVCDPNFKDLHCDHSQIFRASSALIISPSQDCSASVSALS